MTKHSIFKKAIIYMKSDIYMFSFKHLLVQTQAGMRRCVANFVVIFGG